MNPTNTSPLQTTNQAVSLEQANVVKRKRKAKPSRGYTVALTIGGLPLVQEPIGTMVREPEAVRRLLDDISNLAQEAVVVLTLNQKYRLIDRHLVTLGIANASLCHPREVFRPAIMDGASAVIVGHNHPSGDPTPSSEDCASARQLVESGKVIGIQVLDSIVIGRPGFSSLREAGLVDFA